MRGERVGQFGGERGAAGPGGEHGRRSGGRPAPAMRALAPQQREGVVEFGGEGLGGVGVGGDGGAAAGGDLVEPVGHGLQRGRAGRLIRPTRSVRASSGVSRAQKAPVSAGGRRGALVAVAGGGEGQGEAADLLRRASASGAVGGGDGGGGAAAPVGLFDEVGRGPVRCRRSVSRSSRSSGPAQPGRVQRDCCGVGPVGGEQCDRAAAGAERGEQVGDAAALRAAAGDQEGARAAVGAQRADAGLLGEPSAVRTRAPAAATPRSSPCGVGAGERLSGSSSSDSSNNATSRLGSRP